MKKLKNILIAFALLLVVGLPMFIVGCGENEPKIEVTTELKTEYYVGEQLDVTGGILTYTDKDGKETLVSITTEMVSGFSSETAGTRDMVIKYNEETILVSYTIKVLFEAQKEVLYYHENSALTVSRGYHDYLYFNATSQTFYFSTSNVSPDTTNAGLDTYLKDDEHCLYNYSKNIINDKVVYTRNAPTGIIFTLTVVDAETITCNITGSGTTMIFDFTLYKA